MVNVATCIDTIGSRSSEIPQGTAFVGAYVSGINEVPWPLASMERFPIARVIRIYQGAGIYPGIGGYDMIDVESEAVTVAQCASEIEKRVQNDYEWTIVYGTDATLSDVATAVQALGENVWAGHILCFLADWNLNESQAEAKLGTQIHGITCVGVQWASPSSNPKTIAPGTGLSLKTLDYDLSVVDASRLPLPPKQVPTAPPAQPAITGMVVYDPLNGPYSSKDVTSIDGGKTWA